MPLRARRESEGAAVHKEAPWGSVDTWVAGREEMGMEKDRRGWRKGRKGMRGFGKTHVSFAVV
jgi:hypothetical protein